MSKEKGKKSSYFLRTQSTILSGKNQMNFNSFRDKILIKNNTANKKYSSTVSNKIRNKRYITRNQDKKNNIKQDKKKTYVGIDLQKVSGSSHLYKSNIIKKQNKNKVKCSFNYYQYLTRKNKQEKEEEKNININVYNNETNKQKVYKSGHYSPFREIISNIKDKNKANVFYRNKENINYNNKYLLKASLTQDDKNKEENQLYFSSYDKSKNIVEKEQQNYINYNLDYSNKYDNNFNKNNNSRYAYNFNKINNNNKVINNQKLYLINDNLENENSKNKKTSIMNQIKSISKTNSYNINNNSNKEINNKINIYNKNLKLKINKSYSLSNYNYNINFHDKNVAYTPLPYKSFLKSIFDQNNTDKFIKDFNVYPSSRKENTKFEYDKNDDNLKKMLECVPRHLKENNKSDNNYLIGNINSVYQVNQKKNDFYYLNKNKNNVGYYKNKSEQINNIMPPNILIESEKENFN